MNSLDHPIRPLTLPFSQEELLELSYPDGGRFSIQNTNEAFSFCRQLAKLHYENFPVGSLMIPKHLQPHFFSVYAFSRLADDIADELTNSVQSEKFHALERLENMLLLHDHTSLQNPILHALHRTMKEKHIPALPFQKLLTAFRMDSDFHQAETWSDTENYCAYSANPVGEIVLRIYGLYNEHRAPFSDAICTGLQLANFWQDFSRDIPNGRIFIPQQVLQESGLKSEDIYTFYNILQKETDEKVLKSIENQFLPCFQVLFHQTKSYFTKGTSLLKFIDDRRLRAELAFTVAGGEIILEAAYSLGIQIFRTRPSISKRYIFLLLRRFTRHFLI